MPKKLLFEYAYIGSKIEKDVTIEFDDKGIITAVSKGNSDHKQITKGIALPGFVNGHSHSFQYGLRNYTSTPQDFKDWVKNYLYDLVENLTLESMKRLTKKAYEEMLISGITTVAEFHYLYKDLPPATSPKEVINGIIEVAKEVGIRLRLFLSGYDLGSKPAQKKFQMSFEELKKIVTELHFQYLNDPQISIGVAPHSLHGASEEMILGLSDLANELDIPCHIHLAEQYSDIEEARESFNDTPLGYLNRLGIITERLHIIHGIWLTQEEIKLFGKKGGTLVCNPITNMYLGDGIVNLDEYYQYGVPVSLGTDANTQINLAEESLMAEYLQRLKFLKMGVLTAKSGEDLWRIRLKMITENGAKSLDLPIGSIEVGKYCDLAVINLDTELNSEQKIHFTIGHAISEVIVGGQKINLNC